MNHWVYLLFSWTVMYTSSKLLAFKQSFKSHISNYCISHFGSKCSCTTMTCWELRARRTYYAITLTWAKCLVFNFNLYYWNHAETQHIFTRRALNSFELRMVNFMPRVHASPLCKIRASLVLQSHCHLERFSWMTGCPALLGFSGACFGVFSRLHFFFFACGLFMCVHQLFIFLAFVFIFPSYILLSCASWFIRLKWRLRLSKNLRVYPVREARCSTAM